MEAAPFLFWCIPHLGIVGGTAYSSLQKLIETLEGVSLGTVLAVQAQDLSSNPSTHTKAGHGGLYVLSQC